MTLRNNILTTLTTQHPEACSLLVKLIQAIDLEKRSKSEHGEVMGFDLCDLVGITEATLDNLSHSDTTTEESDHAMRVLHALVVDLESKGVRLQSAMSEKDIRQAQPQDILCNETSVEQMSYAKAKADAEEDEYLSIWAIEIGLFDDEDDPRTPFETHLVYVAAEEAGETYSVLDKPIAGLLINNRVRVEAIGSAQLERQSLMAVEV